MSISSERVCINGVSIDDAGTHTATWRNIEGAATFTLDLNVIRKFCMVLLGIMLLKQGLHEHFLAFISSTTFLSQTAYPFSG